MDRKEIEKQIKILNTQVATLLGREPLIIKVDGGMRAIRLHGQCIRKTNGEIVIRISNTLAHEQDIKETILHELCHAYAPLHSHHGCAWQTIAQKVGAAYGVSITRCNSREHTVGPIAYLVCPCCGAKGAIYGRNNKRYSHPEHYYCTKCGRKTYGRMKLEYTNNN